MRLLIITFILLSTLSVSAQFSLQGKLRTLHPLTIKVCDLKGTVITECEIKSNKEFKTKPVHIITDLYVIHFGEYTENLILTDNPLKLSGFLNDKNPESSTMNFDGIDLHLQYLDINARFFNGNRFLKTEFLKVVQSDKTILPVIRATLMHENENLVGKAFEPYKRVLDMISEEEREAQVIQFIMNEVAKRQHVAVGQPAPDFTFVDVDGNNVSLKDFRGKFVLLDFSASWCGGCRLEAKYLASIYDKIKGDDLIILTISLDNREKDWRRMVEEDKLPWLTLWDSEGFTKGNKPNKMQAAYGFYQIPFIVLIDKSGNLIARELRGENIKEAIEKARKTNNVLK